MRPLQNVRGLRMGFRPGWWANTHSGLVALSGSASSEEYSPTERLHSLQEPRTDPRSAAVGPTGVDVAVWSR